MGNPHSTWGSSHSTRSGSPIMDGIISLKVFLTDITNYTCTLSCFEVSSTHQHQKQVNPRWPALFAQEGHVEVLLQPELLGVVWQLPDLAHQGGQGVCRPSLPHPPHQVIPSWRTPWSIAFEALQQLPLIPRASCLLIVPGSPSPKVWALPPLSFDLIFYWLPGGINNMSMASAACCYNHLSCCPLSRHPCLCFQINMTSSLL